MKAANTGSRSCLAVVLAAGEGKRMRSELPKVLHKAAGREMLAHVLDAVAGAGASALAVVVGPDREDVAALARKCSAGSQIFTQAERRGTAHAVLAAQDALSREFDDVLIVFADTPLISSKTLMALREALAAGASVACLGFEPKDPTGYGRLILDETGAPKAIREHKDAHETERAIGLCNAGIIALDGHRALDLLRRITPDNSQNEFYLTDAVALAYAHNFKTSVRLAPADEVMGVNDRAQLAQVEDALQKRLREQAMLAGATLVAPDTVFFSFDTKVGRDVFIEPNVWFGPGVIVENGAKIRAFSHLEGARVGQNAVIGPFARLRPGACLREDSKVGNFVEIKAAEIGVGAKVSHLSYIGDAAVGANANIGAGVVTCNYDGFKKFKTEIGEGAFVGTNSSLVAPVRIGAGSYVATGSVVTHNVAPDALAVARARQFEKPNWALKFRNKNQEKN